VASTTSVYTSQIDVNYPRAGQENSSQGFRNNFSLIKQAINSADSDISYLKSNAVKLGATNNFGYNIIQDAVLQNTVEYGIDNSLGSPYSGDITVDYTQGQYQRFNIAGGLNATQTVSVINWPNENNNIPNELTRASIRLFFTAPSTLLNDVYITFPGNYINLGPESLPQKITAGTGAANPRVFEVSYDGTNYFVQQLSVYPGEIGSTATTTSTGFATGSNTYSTDSTGNTIVKHGSQFATLAQIPSTVVTSATGYTNYPNGGYVFTVTSVVGISQGAKFTVSTTSTPFFVDYTNPATNQVISTVSYHWPFESIKFVNPQFSGSTTILNLNSTLPGSVYSERNDLAGQVYVDSSATYMTYADYSDPSVINKLLISGDNTPNPRALGNSTATTQSLGDSSKFVATTEFVQNAVNYNSTATTVTNALYVVSTSSNGYGSRIISTNSPTGGNPGDIWYQI
jgi:hypothetical protein